MGTDLLAQLWNEAHAYKSLNDILSLVETQGQSLAHVPLQPLYIALKNASIPQVSQILPRLTSDQRQALLDLDLWAKDEIHSERGVWWLKVYADCEDDKVRADFAQSEDFLTYLCKFCAVQTFDAEDPQYPEHDRFFITEDQLLLIEYPEHFQQAQELEGLIKDLYTELGVEAAYAHLFKMVGDSFMSMEEQLYQQKKERLRDWGFVDYYDALETQVPYPSLKEMDKSIRGQTGQTGELEPFMTLQMLHAAPLIPFREASSLFEEEFRRLQNPKRVEFLKFNFTRLVNASLSVDQALGADVTLTVRSGKKVKQLLLLGLSYIKKNYSDFLQPRSVFEVLTFQELYRVGKTLLDLPLKHLKRSLLQFGFEAEEDEAFLGLYWEQFLSAAFETHPSFKLDGSSNAALVESVEIYEKWHSTIETLQQSLPFYQKLHQTFKTLRKEERIQDDFYLNYDLDDIDVEALLLSSFVNFVCDSSGSAKMGVKVADLKKFYTLFFVPHDGDSLLKPFNECEEKLIRFKNSFGFESVMGFEKWLYQIMVEQMNGYNLNEMKEEDYAHIGGPILLKM
jgi:hypothetical protein